MKLRNKYIILYLRYINYWAEHLNGPPTPWGPGVLHFLHPNSFTRNPIHILVTCFPKNHFNIILRRFSWSSKMFNNQDWLCLSCHPQPTTTLHFYYCDNIKWQVCNISFLIMCNNQNNISWLIHRDRTKCVDINECTETRNGGCNMDCINTQGSFFCACSDGYILHTDQRTCIGNLLCGFMAVESKRNISKHYFWWNGNSCSFLHSNQVMIHQSLSTLRAWNQ